MDDKPHFNISAFVVKQLGEELVSDEVTAILELVKNAYDADSKFARVIVDTKSTIIDKDSYFCASNGFPQTTGYIVIEDGGIGMTKSEITNGWLTIRTRLNVKCIRKEFLLQKKKERHWGKKDLGG